MLIYGHSVQCSLHTVCMCRRRWFFGIDGDGWPRKGWDARDIHNNNNIYYIRHTHTHTHTHTCGYKPEHNNMRVRNNTNSNNILTTATAVLYLIWYYIRPAAVRRAQPKNSVKSPSRTGCILLLLLLYNSATVLHVCVETALWRSSAGEIRENRSRTRHLHNGEAIL